MFLGIADTFPHLALTPKLQFKVKGLLQEPLLLRITLSRTSNNHALMKLVM
jgi:hypothetical protein